MCSTWVLWWWSKEDWNWCWFVTVWFNQVSMCGATVQLGPRPPVLRFLEHTQLDTGARARCTPVNEWSALRRGRLTHTHTHTSARARAQLDTHTQFSTHTHTVGLLWTSNSFSQRLVDNTHTRAGSRARTDRPTDRPLWTSDLVVEVTTHTTQKKRTSMPPAGFGPTIPTIERPQTPAS